MNKKTGIVLLIAIIVILLTVVSSFIILNNHNEVEVENITTNNTTSNVTNITEDIEDRSTKTVEAHGYCAICGAPLSLSEAENEYTQGKVCMDCANNPYYQTKPGSDYANQKLEEAYPEDYNGIANEEPINYENEY